jgi:hypothetical protein
MRGSLISNPVGSLAPALLGGVGATILLATSVLAADQSAGPASVGPPVQLVPPSTPHSVPAATPKPAAHAAAVASPGKHLAAPVERIPLDGQALIPPAALPAKLGPPPDPRPALSLETDLQSPAPAGASPSQSGAAGAAAPPAAKPPSS